MAVHKAARAAGVAAALIFLAGTGSGSEAREAPFQPSANCARSSTGYVPLTDLRTRTYEGYEGGLYPRGANEPPAFYDQMGLAYAQQVQLLNGAGQPDPANGRVVLLSIGMSNTTQEYSRFKQIADADAQKNPRVTIVDGAQGGQDAEIIRDPNSTFWANVNTRLTNSGVTAQQVQAAWLKEAVARENRKFPADAQGLKVALAEIVSIMRDRYPNLKLIYLSSRIYAGYADTILNPEPYAYQGGFAVKWLIEERMKADANLPWLAWGPYMWADGLRGRGTDTLVWRCEDLQSDGTHPSTSGRQKVADMLLRFFKTEPTAASWFLRH